MIQLKITGVAQRSSSEVGTSKFTYHEDDKPRTVERFHGAMWEEIEFQLVPEDKPTISVANIEGSGYLVGNIARILINDPALFGTFKTGDVINFVPVIVEAPEPPAPAPAETAPSTPAPAAAPKPVIDTTADEPAAIVVPQLL